MVDKRIGASFKTRPFDLSIVSNIYRIILRLILDIASARARITHSYNLTEIKPSKRFLYWHDL